MRTWAIATTALALLTPTTASMSQALSPFVVVKSLLDEHVVTKRREARRRLVVDETTLPTTPTFLNQHRRFGKVDETDRTTLQETITSDSVQMACDAAFLQCLRNDQCTDCFGALQTEGIDWAAVTPETPCTDVTTFLFKGGHCTSLEQHADAIDTFCTTFDSCVIWDDDSSRNKKDNSTKLDCNALTKCDWPGVHMQFIGDGICHDGIGGCYNHAICGYDGGDCCQDTCEKDADFFYVKCGVDGYACKDPFSTNCDRTLNPTCPRGTYGGDDDDSFTACNPGLVPYRLIMYDSFGDGWDATTLTLKSSNDANAIFVGGLKDGSQGMEYVCLSATPTCYHIEVNGGVWGNEVSWEIKPMGEGTRAVADGGSPMACDFDVGGQACSRTCLGKPNGSVDNDPDYKTYKDMYACMQKKCIIQVGTCEGDSACQPCFTQNAPEYCFANDNFNAVIDCGLCHCTGDDGDEDMSDFCQQKSTPGAVVPSKGNSDGDAPRPCSADQTLKGSSAVITFGKCTKFDQVGMMVTDFDENNFGALDTFEACAHSFTKDTLHGGKTALQCMQVLANAIKQPTEGNSTAPTEAIASLASLLYHDAESFCECASQASNLCPLCPSFLHFKTLLYESLDACQALDEIDCDAWSEFYSPCKSNLMQFFSSVDFTNQAQCDYVADTCGGAGPFPAFRKLDCGREITKPAWDFYNLYSRSCLKGTGPSTTSAPTAPAPVPAPSAAKTVTPATTIPVPPPDSNTPKPYVPPDGGNSEPTGKKNKHRFLKFLIFVGLVGGLIYWYHKRRSDSFDFVRYRRARNYGGESEMYSGLTMDSGSSSFEPPTLPPPPSALDDDMM